MSPNETRHSLIFRLQGERNEIAWREFVSLYEGFLQQCVRRRGVPERDIPDATQQILIAIARSIEHWKDDGKGASFRRWLSTIARNVVIRFLSTQRRQPGAVGGTDQLELMRNIEGEPDPQQLQCYEHELILWAAEQVRHEFLETSWKAFWGTLIEDRPVDEMARALGVSPGSIYMSRSRIMARIRKRIEEIDGEPS